MPVDVRVPLSTEGEASARFPCVCVYCGEPAVEHKAYTTLIKGRDYAFQVPYCAEHKRVADLVNATINNVERMTLCLAVLYFVVAITAMVSGKHGEIGAVFIVGAVCTVLVFPFVSIYLIKPLVSLVSRSVRDTHPAGVLGFVARPLKEAGAIHFLFSRSAYASLFVETNEETEVMQAKQRR